MIRKMTTKDYLDQSARELLSKKDVEKVTVKEICDNCNLSTRTFYKYYKDKYEIINFCFNSEINYFFERPENEITFKNLLRYTTEIVYNHLNFYENVFRYSGQNNIRVSLINPLTYNYQRIIKEYFHTEITKDIENALDLYLHGQLAHVDETLALSVFPTMEETIQYFEDGMPAILIPFMGAES